MTRNLETALAVRLLVDHIPPMVDDACSLARILAESVINAAFIIISDESMAQRFDAWGDYLEAKQESDSLKAFPKTTPEEQKEVEEAIDRLRDRALQEFPDFKDQRGQDFWKKSYDRAKAVDDAVGNRDFAILHESWRALSNYVHQNALVLRERIKEDKNGIGIGRFYTGADKARVLFACNESLFALCWMLDQFYCGKTHAQEWDRLSRAWRPYAYAAPEV
jgi:Family of unknown function (DUF5677)